MIQQRKPIPRKRSKPRRGRVIDKPRLAWAATQPCQITGEFPATTHHVRSFGSSRDDTKIIRLVARLHMKTHAGFRCCIEDGKKIFEETYECSIEALVRDLDRRYYESPEYDATDYFEPPTVRNEVI